MLNSDRSDLNRRTFLQTTAATAALASAASIASAQDKDGAVNLQKQSIPTRKLGKTGVDVTLLNMGTWRNTGTDRLLRFAFANGVRVFDTADCYGSEPNIKKWFQAAPEIRKQIFLVTKDHPKNGPSEMVEDA